ncbi:MAG TPA: WbqC family protein [Anaerolineales bacterium]|nr:WbqC family protein [Anaerolineales bacterium]
MNVVILQPSYIPWRGYFDQIRRADLFIFYDDVQYDKHGWRNRNQIKTHQGKQWLTIPVHTKGVMNGTLIKDVRIDWSKPWTKHHFKGLTSAYNKAPHFKEHFPFLESFYQRRDEFLADFTIETSITLARQLGFTSTQFMRSSEIADTQGRKTDRIIHILRRIGATHYICGPAASSYMEPEKFDAAGITFEYMEYQYPEYPQLYPPYDPYVSILDLMFMMGKDSSLYFESLKETNHES